MEMQSDHSVVQSAGNFSPDSGRSSPFEHANYLMYSPSDTCSHNTSACDSASRLPSTSASEASSIMTIDTIRASSIEAEHDHEDVDNDITPTSPASDYTPASVHVFPDSPPPATEAERLTMVQAAHDLFYSDDASARERCDEWDRADCGETEELWGQGTRSHDGLENQDDGPRQEPMRSS